MPDIPGDPSTTTELTIGGSVSSQIEVNEDADWIRVDLTAGQGYRFELNGSGLFPDIAMRAPDSGDWIYGYSNGSGSAYLDFVPRVSGTYYVVATGFAYDYPGDYTLSVEPREGAAPVFSNTEIASYLTDGYWNDKGEARHAFASTTLTFNIQPLDAEGRALALAALEAWSAVSNLTFVETTEPAMINFDDTTFISRTTYFATGNTTTRAFVNINLEDVELYGNATKLQYYIREIGHALGLGDAGLYNLDRDEIWSAFPFPGSENHYLTDSFQATVMSIFDTFENTYVAADFGEVVGPMMADIIAIQDLYGVPTDANAGATTYGYNSTAEDYRDLSEFDGSFYVPAFTIYDSGGIDTLDASGYAGDQVIDLRAGAYSDIARGIGNIGIAENTVIEKAVGGGGNDTLRGNDTANTLNGRASTDTAYGFGGNDSYYVDNADDRVFEAAGAGTDRVLANVSYVLADGQSIEVLSTFSGTSTASINLTGNALDQIIQGNAAANILDGRGGDDVINGGGGADTAFGRDGNDIFHVDEAGDRVFEATNGGNDRALASTSYALEAGQSIETLATSSSTGTAAINLTGNELYQSIQGNAGNNVINGRGGTDFAYGLSGNDTYYVERASDLVFEAAGAGTDIVRAMPAMPCRMASRSRRWRPSRRPAPAPST